MANVTPAQQNAVKTYLCGDFGNLKKWYAAKDPETVFVDTGDEIIAVKRIIDDHIKITTWAEMSPFMKDEVQRILSPTPSTPAQATKYPQIVSSNGQPVHYAPAWKKWKKIHQGRHGWLPEVMMSLGFIIFLLCCALGFISGPTVSFFIFPITGVLIWFLACVFASLLNSIRAIETYAANIYEQTRSLNGKE